MSDADPKDHKEKMQQRQAEQRAKVAELVDASETLRQRGAAGAKFEELVDRLREEVEKDVMVTFADKAWELMTDERGEVGGMIAEAVQKRLGER